MLGAMELFEHRTYPRKSRIELGVRDAWETNLFAANWVVRFPTHLCLCRYITQLFTESQFIDFFE